MGDQVVVEAGSEQYERIRAVLEAGDNLVLEFEPARRIDRFEHGDKVQVPFDAGWGPAVVDSADGEYVKVRYGPKGRPNDLRFSTSLERSSVRTTNCQLIRATVTVR